MCTTLVYGLQSRAWTIGGVWWSVGVGILCSASVCVRFN